jgi:ribosomal protein S18 acetylase RimI-like enzyme
LERHVIVRDALPGELPEIGALRVSAYAAGGFLPPGSGYADTLRALGSGGDGEVLVAEDGRRILGTVMLAPFGRASELASAPDEADIRALAVAPSAQGRGVGRLLLRAVIARAGERGIGRLLLATRPSMLAAQRLYDLEGFRRAPHRDWQPIPGVTLLAYERRTPPHSTFPAARAGASD